MGTAPSHSAGLRDIAGRRGYTTGTDPIADRLTAAFPLEGATESGTSLLFLSEEEFEAGRRLAAMTWLEVAERIDGIVDSSLISSMSPADFRYYLPGLMLGVGCHETAPGSVVGFTAFSGLYSYSDPGHWDARFVDRWCRFSDTQYDVLEDLLPPLLIEHPGDFNGSIAHETLALARMHATDLRMGVR